MCRWIFLIAFDCDLSDQPTHYLTLRPKSFICERYLRLLYSSNIYITYIYIYAIYSIYILSMYVCIQHIYDYICVCIY